MRNSDRFMVKMERSVKGVFFDAVKVAIRKPSLALFMLKIFLRQISASRRRSKYERKGFHVPPFIIFSITNRCNLHCKGCYNQALHAAAESEISSERMESILAEASDLGISIALIGGGEPLIRQDVQKVISRFPRIVFPLFTNGLLIDENKILQFRKHRNIVPVLSIEGDEELTDNRRGKGVYGKLRNVVYTLRRNNIFFGLSLTVTRENFYLIQKPGFLSEWIDSGCRLFFFVEYIPVKEGTENLAVTDAQRQEMVRMVDKYRKLNQALFMLFPAGEEEFGGCLSAGRGFVHVSSSGNLEPCPFAPYSDVNLQNTSLKAALQSEFLRKIRENHTKLSEHKGCALWENREWVRMLSGEDVHQS